jgi:hypothetical protein
LSLSILSCILLLRDSNLSIKINLSVSLPDIYESTTIDFTFSCIFSAMNFSSLFAAYFFTSYPVNASIDIKLKISITINEVLI